MVMNTAKAMRTAFTRWGGRDTAPPSAAGRLVYAVGDIHGRYDLLKDLLALLAHDYGALADGRKPFLVFLGDYIDRGPDSALVLEALLWLQRRPEIEVCCLRGNHEQAMLDFIDAPENAQPWLKYGGAETLAAYGVAPPDVSRMANLARARDELLERMPASHLRLLQKLELMLAVGDYAFVHAGVRPGAALDRQAEEDLLWIREEFLSAPGPFDKVIVHGHSWTDEQPTHMPHRIGVDTGAYATGVLTAARIEDAGVTFLQTRSAQAAA